MLKISTRLLLLLPVWLLMHPLLANDGNLQKGWEAFHANKRDDAKKYLQLATGDASTREEAHLLLSLIAFNEGKTNEAFTHFSSFYAQASNPYPYAYALWTTDCINGNYGKKSPEKVAFLKKVIDDPNADGTMKAMAHYMLGNHYQETWDHENARKEFASLGAITDWQLAGTFENISGSGFDKSFGPIASSPGTAEFTSRVGAKVKWFPMQANRTDQWMDLSYHLSYTNSITYAQTFVNSPAEQEIVVRAGVSGSIKVWVNDKLIIAVADERNTDLDTYNYTAKLSKGYNRILVQIGASEIDRANFMIRLTDQRAHPVPGLSYSASYQSYPKAAAYESKHLPLLAETFFEQQTTGTVKSPLAWLLLAETYLRNDKSYEARKALNALRKTAPDNSYVVFRLMDVYSRSNNRTELSKEMERLKENDPQNLISLTMAVEEAKEKEEYDEVERLLQVTEKMYGVSENTFNERISLAAKRKKYDEVIRLGNAAYEKYPDSYSFVNIKYFIEADANKNKKAAIAVLEKYIKKNFDENAIRQLSNIYLKDGNTEKGIKYFNDLIKHVPYATGYYSSMADIYFGLRDYPKAMEWVNKAIAQAPYYGAYWEEKGKLHEQLGQNDLAKEAYRKCIEYSPNSYDVRKQLRKLDAKKDVYTYFQQPDVYSLCKKTPGADAYPNDNSIILHNEVQHIVYPEGSSEKKTIILAKVFNSSGIDDWKEYSIPYNSYGERLNVEKAEVIKPNGNKIAAEVNGSYVVFTTLEAGDAIHLTYKVESHLVGRLAHHFWDKFNFNYFYPCQISKYTLLIADERKFEYTVSNTDVKPVIQNADEFQMLVWEKKNMPGVTYEPYMPPLDDIGQVLHLSSIPDWNYVANWYADLSAAKAKADFEVKEAVAQVFAGTSNLSDTQKAKKIYEYILQNIRYSSISFRQSGHVPQKASKTISTKLGDCKDMATLFVAMAKEVGVKANLVLVDTRDNGAKNMVLPSIEFNHCIARLQADGKEYFVELTAEHLPFGAVTYSLNKAMSLIIPQTNESGTYQLTALQAPSRPLNNVYRETEIRLENNDLVIKRRNVRAGAFAESFRRAYTNTGKDVQEKQLLQGVSEDFSSSVKLVDFSFKNLNALTDSVENELVLRVKNGSAQVGGMQIMTLPWADREKSMDFLSSDERNFVLNFFDYDISEMNREVITLLLPPGKTLAEVPSSQSFRCKAMEYAISFQMEAGKLIVTRVTKYHQDVISTENYQEFKEFFTKMVEADAKQIALKDVKQIGMK